MRKSSRRAFSLLEVLLAMGILFGCIIVLSDLARIGGRNARRAEDLTAAQRVCQTKMNEVLAGLEYPESVQKRPIEGEPGWVYSVARESAKQQGLIAVRVTVAQDLPEEKGPREFSLVRWMRSPEESRNAGSSESGPPRPRRSRGDRRR